MKIRVHSSGSRRGVSFYSMLPERKGEGGGPLRGDLERLQSLKPRIEIMARQVLGASFKEVRDFDSRPYLCVEIGTSRGPKKFALRDLLGWIALVSNEP